MLRCPHSLMINDSLITLSDLSQFHTWSAAEEINDHNDTA